MRSHRQATLAVVLMSVLACQTAAIGQQELSDVAAEKLAEKVAEKVTAKAKEKAQRPGRWWEPTKVHFLIFIIDIDSINAADQNFSANVFVRLRWQDERLADGNTTSMRQMSLNAIWNPRVILANQTGIVRLSLPEVAQVGPDGMVTYFQRYVGTVSQPLLLSEFPLDEHRFAIEFIAVGYTADNLEFLPDTGGIEGVLHGGGISDELSLPDWRILDYKAEARPYEPVTGVRAAAFRFEFLARRRFNYYLWQVIVPLAVIVVMSWAALWIPPGEVGVRVGVASSAMLTLIAYRFVLASLLPRLPYMTRMDYLTLGSTVLILLALVEVILTLTLARKNRDRAARWIDGSARLVFPMAFGALILWALVL